MPVTLARARELVEELARELQRRGGEAATAQAYYEGQHPLRFASEQFGAYFADRYIGFSDNWCAVVADSPTERLDPIGIRLDTGDDQAKADLELWKVWQRAGADADASMAFLDASITRRSYGLVWGDDDDPDNPDITFESSTEAIVAYEAGSRRKRAAGLKLWRDDKAEYATLWLPDQVWRMIRHAGVPKLTPGGIFTVSSDGPPVWEMRPGFEEPQPNPLGVVPLVELPNRPLLSREPLSDVNGVMAMQDAVNLLWAQLFTASDFSSFKQRVILGAEPPKLPILNEQGQKVGEQMVDLKKFAVDRVVWLTDPNAKIAEWSADDLTVWTSVIEVAVGHIAAQTRTPQHYLVGKMSNLSADALKAAETGLVKRTEEKQLYYGEAIREMFRLVCLARGEKDKAKTVATGRVQWKDAESRSEAQLVDALGKLKDMGFPFEYLGERYGLSPTELDRVMAMRDRDMERLLLDPALLDGPKGEPDVPPAGQPPLPPADDAGAGDSGTRRRAVANR